ncbi:MAG: D-arabinono-1,4-lactone oxidase, partial [Chloroflexota bacterium]
FGPGSGAPLSFPIEGWTLAVDFPAGHAALGAFLDTLDERVAAAGGRVYLAKDARMRAEMVPLMYPRLDEWRETQSRVDPRGIFTSDLDRRLHLTRGSQA